MDRQQLQKQLEARREKNRYYEVMEAAAEGDIAFVKEIVDSTGDPDCGGSFETPLVLACLNRHTEVALYLISKGADVNSMTVWGTPFHIAVSTRNFVLVRELLKAGAPPDFEEEEEYEQAVLEQVQRIARALEVEKELSNVFNDQSIGSLPAVRGCQGQGQML